MNRYFRLSGLPILLVILISSTEIYSQEVNSLFQGGLYFVSGIPRPEFKEAVDNNISGLGFGPGFNFLVNPFGKRRSSHIYLGLDLQYLYFGRDKVAKTSTAPPYKTSFNYYSVDGLARFYPMQRPGFNIFVDGMVGAKIMNARTKIDKNALQTIIADEQDEVISNITDSGLGYGVGIGMFVRKHRDTEDGTEAVPSFSLRFVYSWGDHVSYVKRGSLAVDNGLVTYKQGYARTDMFQIQIGVFLF